MADMCSRPRPSGPRADVEFSVAAGEVLAILGPNGAGGSRLRCTSSRACCTDTGSQCWWAVALTDTAANIQIATHRRRVGLLPRTRCCPHRMWNGVPPRAHGVGRRGSATIAMRLPEDVGMAEAAHLRPAEPSGGQAQRRDRPALAAEPDVLLIDEPLAGVDIESPPLQRRSARRVVAKQGRSTVLATHDLLDVLPRPTRCWCWSRGASQSGPVAEVLAAPRSQSAPKSPA